MLTMMLALGVAHAESPDDEYLRIFNLTATADSLGANGNTALAHRKYVEAQAALLAFKKNNPALNVKAVSYRLNYLVEKIAATSEKPGPADSTLTASSPGTHSESARSPARTGQVKLLSAGGEPRKVLRLHPGAGDRQSIGMTTKMAMTMNVGDKPSPPIKLPALQLTMDVTVKNVTPSGDITYDFVMSDADVTSDPEVLPQVGEAMKALLAKIRGLTGTGTLTDHGYNKGTEIQVPPGADPQTVQTLDQMKESFSSTASPLPDEAVGPGARWEFKHKLKSQGMTIDQTTTYELLSVEDERITLRSTIVQSAANQKIQNPAMPGLKVDLTKMTGTGTGNTTFDLAKLMPITGGIDEHTQVAMGINTGTQKQAMNMKVDVNLQFTTR